MSSRARRLHHRSGCRSVLLGVLCIAAVALSRDYGVAQQLDQSPDYSDTGRNPYTGDAAPPNIWSNEEQQGYRDFQEAARNIDSSAAARVNSWGATGHQGDGPSIDAAPGIEAATENAPGGKVLSDNLGTLNTIGDGIHGAGELAGMKGVSRYGGSLGIAATGTSLVVDGVRYYAADSPVEKREIANKMGKDAAETALTSSVEAAPLAIAVPLAAFSVLLYSPSTAPPAFDQVIGYPSGQSQMTPKQQLFNQAWNGGWRPPLASKAPAARSPAPPVAPAPQSNCPGPYTCGTP